MDNKLNYLIILFMCLYLVSCRHTKQNIKNSDNNKFLEIYYFSPHAMFPLKFSCESIKQGKNNNNGRNYLKITDNHFLKNFFSLYNSLKISQKSEIDIDARIQILVHSETKVDTICMGTGYGIIVNGNLKQDCPNFSKLITDEVVKDYNSQK